MTDEVIDTNVDTLFEGEDLPEIKTEPEVEPEVEEGESTGEHEEDDSSLSETPPDDEKPKLIPIAAVLDERRKRQLLRDENKRLRDQLPKNDSDIPDPNEDLEGYNAYLKRQWETESLEKQEEERFRKIDISRTTMLEQHGDFVEMEKIFELMIAANPALAEDRIASGDEPKFAYEKAKAYKEALLNPAANAEEKLKSAIKSPNLAAATAVGSNTTTVLEEKDMMDIFEDQTY